MKVRNFCSKLCLRIQDFLTRFLPHCLLKSNPAFNPTLIKVHICIVLGQNSKIIASQGHSGRLVNC